ncbi:MAG: CHAT domain-containing protein, partial [Acidobacteria bacterium]|nr:CHAT domain-containing protein [Acidobacteriota bacterium]
PGAARRRLDDAEKHGADASPRLLLWQLDLEARLDLQGGKLEAARRGFSRLAEAAEAADSLDARWRAQSGLAQVAEAAGRNEVALEAFARTEALLDEISLRAPLGLGRVSSADPGGGTTRRYLDLLLSLGREEKALEVARRSRSRILRGLLVEGRVQRLEPARARLLHDYLGRYERLAEELDEALASDWQVPGSRRAQVGEERRRQREDLDRLLDQALALIDSQSSVADPGALERQTGEVVLLYHPVSTGWVGFAVAEGGLRTVPLPDLDPGLSPEELGSRLLEPFREELSFASKVRVLGFGWLRLVDFHLLPVGGETLLARAAVVYGLDLPAPIRPATELHRRWALVVADPTETLSAVREEARAVASRLEGFGFSVSLRAGAAAHRREVLKRLGTVEVFHFAGHAETSAGLDGALLLSRGGRLTVGDVLAASSLPESVVLSACGSASSASEATDPFLGLAQAFLVAGSREVLATSRPVPDEAAARVVTAIYRHWDGKMPLSLALHRAWLEEGNEAEEAWGAFRIFER